LPSPAGSASGFVEQGLFGIGWLKAQALFGLSGLDEISHSLWWSLLANIGLYVVVSLNSRPDAVEAGQAERFRRCLPHDPQECRGPYVARQGLGGRTGRLARTFPGPARTPSSNSGLTPGRGARGLAQLPADAEFVHFAEAELAGAIGSASARVMVASVAQEEIWASRRSSIFLTRRPRCAPTAAAREPSQQELEAATIELREANERCANWTA
jgi:hypothetical protein